MALLLSPAVATPQLFDIVVDAFDSQKWNYRTIPDHRVLEVDLETTHSKVVSYVQVFEEIKAVSAVTNASVTVPKSHLSATAELLMRTKQELTVGNLEMLWDEGLVMFKMTNLFQEANPSIDTVLGMIQTTLAEIDRITPFLSTLVRTPADQINVPTLMSREDLLGEDLE